MAVRSGDMRDATVNPTSLPADLQTRLGGYSAIQITTGESGGVVHRLSAPGRSDCFLKLGRGAVADDITHEMLRLTWLDGRLPAPRVLHFVRNDDHAALLSSALPGVAAAEWMAEHPERAGDAVHCIADFLRQLHALPVEHCPFEAGHVLRLAAARQRLDAGLVDEEDFDEARAGMSAEAVWAEMQAMLPRSFERVVTHGDFSLDNIFLEDGRVTGCLDVGRLGVADPYQDVAILWNNLSEFGSELQEAWLSAYGVMPPDNARLAFHCCLDEFF
jgi:aminoglycoside 3'-phosphotransferase-1